MYIFIVCVMYHLCQHVTIVKSFEELKISPTLPSVASRGVARARIERWRGTVGTPRDRSGHSLPYTRRRVTGAVFRQCFKRS